MVNEDITQTSQKQRRGRVGRKKPGTVYYLYDDEKLPEKTFFKITLENITDLILSMLNTVDTRIINKLSDPYRVTLLQNIPKFLQKQYSMIYNFGQESVLYRRDKLENFDTRYNIIYPYADGGYDFNSLTDLKGEFYIVHPNEDVIVRKITENENPSLEIVKNIERNSNKIFKIVENNKINGLINESNMLTPYGKFITNTSREYEITDIKFILSMMDAFGYGVNIESEICKNLMLSYIFKSDNINYALKPKFIKGNADFLVLMIYIPEVLFSLINTDYIINYIINNLDKINTKNINNLIDNIINRLSLIHI